MRDGSLAHSVAAVRVWVKISSGFSYNRLCESLNFMVGFPGLMFYGRNAPWYISCPFLAVQVYCTRATTVTYKT
jgi:hypothetical protein